MDRLDEAEDVEEADEKALAKWDKKAMFIRGPLNIERALKEMN